MEVDIRILVTGGAGYIGSHAVVEPLQAGHAITVLDSLVNASRAVLPRRAELGWRAERGIDEMCRDTWRWQSAHPRGFADVAEVAE